MLELKVCIGSSCHLKGSYNVLQAFLQLAEEYSLHGQVEIQSQFCMKRCQYGVSVSFLNAVYSVSPETAGAFFKSTVLPALEQSAPA